PIAQGIEHRSPEAGAQVRFLLGARTAQDQPVAHAVQAPSPDGLVGFDTC
ncbi:MAG: hypothetical protein RL600_668, partial [Actinomycetota bacterium]